MIKDLLVAVLLVTSVCLYAPYWSRFLLPEFNDSLIQYCMLEDAITTHTKTYLFHV